MSENENMNENEIIRDSGTPAAEEPQPAEQAEPEKGKKKKEKKKKSVGAEILSWVLTIVVAVAAALVIRSFVFELVRVEGGSMQNTLEDKEIMFVSKFDYSSTWLSLPFQSNNAVERAPRIVFGTPNRLDVVICRYPARGGVNFVKRVVGLPGETMELKDGYLWIDGKQIEEESRIEGITDQEHDYRQGTKVWFVGTRCSSCGNLYAWIAQGENRICAACGATYPKAYYIPKKGDTLRITTDGLRINGAAWDRLQTCVVAKDTDGKTLKIYTRNRDDSSRATQIDYLTDTETVFSYDGKAYTQDEFFRACPKLADTDLAIDEDYYFVMGDHRNNSNDSRMVGAIERSAVIGHARSVVFPFANWRGVE